MIAALVWKEYREQRLAWAALAALGAATLFGLPALIAPGGLASESQDRAWIISAVVLVAWAYGLICGAMLLAAEREMGTLPFLDALPGLRGQLWRAKCLSGLLLVVAQAVVLTVLAAAARLFPTWTGTAAALVAMAGAALFGLAWGMLFSSFGRSVMNMILLSLAGQLAAVFLFFIPAAFLSALIAHFFSVPPDLTMNGSWGAVAALSIPVALGASALLFTRPDRGRLRPAAPIRAGRPRAPWGRLFWLARRQSRLFTVGLGLFSVLLGLLTLADGLVLWPAATLLVGVLCGATAFADERQGAFRFLGDQRFPLGRYWIVKVGHRFLLAVVAALLVLAPSVLRMLTASPEHNAPSVVGSGLLLYVLNTGLVLFLLLGLVCGFCSGCLFGLLIRNGLASGVFALGSAVLLTAVWVPSLIDGGLNWQQPLGPPLLLLAATPLLLRPWAAGRIVSWTTVCRLAPFAVLAGLWIAFGLWYRVLEIPNVAPKYDLAAFRASLPKPDDNPAGDRVRSACVRFADLRAKLDAEQPGVVGARPQPAVSVLFSRLVAALHYGWPAADAELDDYLSRLGDDEWRTKLVEAADLPTGMAEDPRLLTLPELKRLPEPRSAPAMALVLAASGLRKQAHGDDAAFVEDLRVGLSLSRNLRHDAPRRNAEIGQSVENILLIGADRWLERLDGRPDLLKQALALLSDHRKEAEAEDGDRVRVDYLIARNTLDEPLDWLTDDLNSNYGSFTRSDDRAHTEALAMVQARLVPWEQARQERLLRVEFEGDTKQLRSVYGFWQPIAMLGSVLRLGPEYSRDYRNGFERCRAPAMQLKLALRWYQAENGRPAEKLDDLVPKYLPKIPDDPYLKGEPFHYRLSKGEKIRWEPDALGGPAPAGAPQAPAMPEAAPLPPLPPPSIDVPAGQGVLWSVGSDGQDDGGVEQAAAERAYTVPGEDVIFLVPLPPKEK